MSAQRRAKAQVSLPCSTAAERSRLLLLVILLLGAFLRFYRLGAQSLWNDEGNSARLAERSLPLIVEGAAGDIHPPGYYLLLHYWRALFGQSEFALRSLSVVAGLALGLVTYLLGRRLFTEGTGLMAAFLSAISPFAIYYSQEARMYALLAALSAASTTATIGYLRSAILEPPSVASNSPSAIWYGRLAACALLTAAGLYTHYAFAFVALANSLVFALWWLIASLRGRPRWPALTGWVGTQAAALLLYLPWLPSALGAPGWSSPGAAYQLGPALLDVLRVLAVGITLPLEKATLALVVVGLLLSIGILSIAVGPSATPAATPSAGRVRGASFLRRPRGLSIASLAVYLALPIALFFALDLYKPSWLKFLIVTVLPFHILVACGIETLFSLLAPALRSARRVPPLGQHATRAVLLLLIIAVVTPSLRNLYFSPAYARDDYRQLAADIQAMRRPGDAIILNAPNQWEVFTYYHPDEDVYPAPYRPSADKADVFLSRILEQHERLFVLYWGDAESDPRRRIESRLAQHAYKAGDSWYGDVRLAIYGLGPLPGESDAALDARFGETMRLSGIALPDRALAPGDIVPVTLFWEAERAIDRPYKITLQLLDGVGHLVAQVDTVPGDGLAPTTSWRAGEPLVDLYGIHLAPDLLAGRYSLIVAVYHATTGERLPAVLDGRPIGDHLGLGAVSVSPNHSSAIKVPA